jgi:hypothetical protein
MNTTLIAVPHPAVKDTAGNGILQDINSAIKNNKLSYQIDTSKVPLSKLSIMSPELKEQKRDVAISATGKNTSGINVDLEGVKVYAVLQ